MNIFMPVMRNITDSIMEDQKDKIHLLQENLTNKVKTLYNGQ